MHKQNNNNQGNIVLKKNYSDRDQSTKIFLLFNIDFFSGSRIFQNNREFWQTNSGKGRPCYPYWVRRLPRGPLENTPLISFCCICFFRDHYEVGTKSEKFEIDSK